MGKNAPDRTQKQRFIDAAKEVGADEDPEAFKERLKKLVKVSTAPRKSRKGEESS